jgi:hypothetical protein
MRGVTIDGLRTTWTDAALLVSYHIVDRSRAAACVGNRSESCWERSSRDWQAHAIVVVHQGDTYLV